VTGEWKWLTLADVLVPQNNRKLVQQGWSPQCHDFPARDGAWGVLKTTAIQPGRFEPQHNKELPAMLATRPQIEVQSGDFLMTCAGPRARCGVPTLVRSTPSRLMMSGKIYRFRPDGRLVPEFLEYYLQSPRAQELIDSMKTGISDSGLNLTHARFVRLPVPVPPLEHQHRIVDFLEDQLSRLEAAQRYICQAQIRLGAVLRSALEAGFKSDQVVPLSNLIEDISAGKSFGGPSPPAHENEWGIIKVSAMTWGEFKPAENKAVPESRVDPRFEIKQGDLLISRANTAEYVGASVLVGPVRPRLLLSDKSLRLTPKVGVNREWLCRALQAPSARAQIAKLATGTKDSMRNISQSSLRQVLLPLADGSKQYEAVSAFNEIAAGVARLRGELESCVRAQRTLTRSLLSDAFSGRLTGQVPLQTAEALGGSHV
jgi:type I restriction enzyme S subunit